MKKIIDKNKSIIESATKLFLKNGFMRTSMDDVALVAKVTKQTVYSHFKNKDNLFKEIVEMKSSEYSKIDMAGFSGNVEEELRKIAANLLNILSDKEVISLNSLIIGEAGKISKVAEIYYKTLPGKILGAFQEYLTMRNKQGMLKIDNIYLAASSFMYGLLGDYYMQLSLGLKTKLSQGEKDEIVDFSVKNFLKSFKA